jgi:uncharacterized protein (DUF488 family)
MRYNNEVLTIGYGGKHPQLFFSELEEMNVDMVIDVRANPFKAYLGVYTKPYLETKLDHYIWVRELGNPSRSLPPVLANEELGLEIAHKILRDYNRVVLLCAEKDERQCHRRYIKSKLLEENDYR